MQVPRESWTRIEAPVVRNMYQYIFDLRNKIGETCQLEPKYLQAAKGEFKCHCDTKTKKLSFEVGLKVVVPWMTADTNKLLLYWKSPYKVVEVAKMDYRVNMGGKSKVFPANLLSGYSGRDEANTKASVVTIIAKDDSIGNGVVNEDSLVHLPM